MNLFELFVKIGVDDQASKETESLKEKLGNGLKTAAKVGVAAVTAASGAIVAFGASSVQTGMEFDKSMSQVAATMGKTVDEITELRDFAQKMGSETAFSASQAADALNYMALAGYNAEQSMEMLPNVLNLAAAGNMELAAASDMVTDSQTALGLSFEQTNVLVDQMAKTASTTNTSVSQLGDAILSVGGTAKNLAGGTNELNAVLGIFADNGIKASEAGIHLRNIMLAMNPQTDDAVAAFEKLGLQAYDNEGKLRALDEIFGDLSKSLGDMTDQEKTEILSDIFNKTDLTTVNALLATSEERWDQVYDAIENANGAAQKMANTQLDNLAGDITLFKSALEGAQIVVSDQLTPTLREFVQFGSNSVSELSNAFKEGGLSGAMDALGTLLSEGLTMITNALPNIINAGVSLLNALIQGISENKDLIFSTAVDTIVTLSNGILDMLPEIVQLGFDLIVSLATGITENLGELIPTIIDVFLQIVEILTDQQNLTMLLDAALQIIVELGYGLMDAIPALVSSVVAVVHAIQVFLTDPENLAMILSAAFQIVVALATGLLKNAPELLRSAAQLLSQLVDRFTSTDWAQIGRDLVAGFRRGIEEAWKNLREWFTSLFGDLKAIAKRILGISSPSKVFKQYGKFVDEGLALGIEQNADVAYSAVGKLAKGVASGFDVSLGTNYIGTYKTSNSSFSASPVSKTDSLLTELISMFRNGTATTNVGNTRELRRAVNA